MNVNLISLEKNFSDGDKITPIVLFEKSLISKKGGSLPVIKILSDGKITKKLVVSGCLFQRQQRKK